MQGFEVSDAGPRVQGFKKRGLKRYLYCFEVLPIIVNSIVKYPETVVIQVPTELLVRTSPFLHLIRMYAEATQCNSTCSRG